MTENTMDKQREKLIELICEAIDIHSDAPYIADHLLANGVIVPPCKVGQTVYVVFNDEVRELKVISYSVLNSTAGNYQNIHTVNSRGAVLSYKLFDIGKTVFLSREDAEKALKANTPTDTPTGKDINVRSKGVE